MPRSQRRAGRSRRPEPGGPQALSRKPLVWGLRPAHARGMPAVEVMAKADAAWLHADEPTNHFVVTSLALLDQRIDPERLKTMLANRLGLHPRLRQVVAPAGPLAPERWVDAPHFDLDAHVRRVALPAPGGMDELAGYVSELAGRPLD